MACSDCAPSKVGDTPTLVAEIVRASTCTALDVSTAVTKTIYLTSPRGVTTPYPASFTTDGTDGKIEIDVPAGALGPDDVGVWRYEGFVELANGKTFTGGETTFLVEESKYGNTL